MITNCTFSDNVGQGGANSGTGNGFAGGLNLDAAATITGCTISGNSGFGGHVRQRWRWGCRHHQRYGSHHFGQHH